MAKAVVIGAGPTGLSLAMLLAQRGIDVVVLDRDPEPPATADEAWDSWERRSVTQFRQVHFLQPRGRAILEEHLPAVAEGMRAAGAVTYNMIQGFAELLPGGPGDLDYSAFRTITTCRRPVLEHAFHSAAGATPLVEVRHGVTVAGLVAGPSVIEGVPHVVGVTTDAGDTITADVVLDASGRRTRVGELIAELGAPAPAEAAEELGFVYNTQFYRGDALPELRGDLLGAAGSFSVLTMPGDHGHWSVTLYHSPQDKAMRRVRDPEVFDRVVRSLPLQAHWADGERVGDVATMASTANTRRTFVVDGVPVATGVLPVGDAWGFTNPSLGRGITLGLVHALDVADVVAAHLDDPSAMATEWERATAANAARWHDATVQYDRVRGPEVEAYRQGLPDPHDPNDMAVAGFRAFDSARHYDPQVLQWYGEQATCFTLADDLVAREGVFERVLDVALSNEPYVMPAPDRATLETLLT